jgi:cation transport ATPase
LAAIGPRVSGFDVLALVGVLIGGYPIFKEAVSDLVERRMTMELSMTIALVAAEIGDIVVVRPGGRIPVDDVVLAGHSFV